MLWLPLVAALLLYSPLARAQWDVDYKHGGQDYKHGGQDYKHGDQDYKHGDQDYKHGDQDYKHGDQDYKHGDQDYKHGGQCCGWRCMLFTLQWPGSFCQSLHEESLCKIPPTVNNWTIHGLWPYKAHNCCQCWPMFHSDVEVSLCCFPELVLV
uniref:Uncharacterized protein n=1 Tax=Neogobius melanostomus TaxID=47308 RepID=A0A8C6SCU0_9GOBI